jgi:hypothetical protein
MTPPARRIVGCPSIHKANERASLHERHRTSPGAGRIGINQTGSLTTVVPLCCGLAGSIVRTRSLRSDPCHRLSNRFLESLLFGVLRKPQFYRASSSKRVRFWPVRFLLTVSQVFYHGLPSHTRVICYLIRSRIGLFPSDGLTVHNLDYCMIVWWSSRTADDREQTLPPFGLVLL